MSISHKAWVFHYDDFERELASDLYAALETGLTAALERFVDTHRAALSTYEGPIEENWREAVASSGDVTPQSVGDLALTKYYNRDHDLGLDHGFDALGVHLGTVSGLSVSPSALVCGSWFGPKGRRFDPGLMGTGFVSTRNVGVHRRALEKAKDASIAPMGSRAWKNCHYKPSSESSVRESLERLATVYARALEQGCGVLFADFHDSPIHAPGY